MDFDYSKGLKAKAQKWTVEESTILAETVDMHVSQPKDRKFWSMIARKITGKSGKQCRERWQHHLRPNLNKNPWTAEEEYKLTKAHSIVGSRWVEVVKVLPDRAENSCKNHFNSTHRSRPESKTKSLFWFYTQLSDTAGPSQQVFEQACKEYSEQLNAVPISKFECSAEIFAGLVPSTEGPRRSFPSKRKPCGPAVVKDECKENSEHLDNCAKPTSSEEFIRSTCAQAYTPFRNERPDNTSASGQASGMHTPLEMTSFPSFQDIHEFDPCMLLEDQQGPEAAPSVLLGPGMMDMVLSGYDDSDFQHLLEQMPSGMPDNMMSSDETHCQAHIPQYMLCVPEDSCYQDNAPSTSCSEWSSGYDYVIPADERTRASCNYSVPDLVYRQERLKRRAEQMYLEDDDPFFCGTAAFECQPVWNSHPSFTSRNHAGVDAYSQVSSNFACPAFSRGCLTPRPCDQYAPAMDATRTMGYLPAHAVNDASSGQGLYCKPTYPSSQCQTVYAQASDYYQEHHFDAQVSGCYDSYVPAEDLSKPAHRSAYGQHDGRLWMCAEIDC